MNQPTIQPADIPKYVVPINVGNDCVSFRHPDYPANSASQQPNRYNVAGTTAYYIASGYDVAKAEVPNWTDRVAYKVAPTTIHVFNLAQWSIDNGCHDLFLQSKEVGGHGLCQQVSNQLTNTYGLSGILYNSEPFHSLGKTGYCLAILPPSGQLVGDTFFVRDYDSKE